MFIRAGLITLMVFYCFFILGCNGSHEPDTLLYIVALGFDKGKEPGKVAVSFHIAVPRTGPSGEGGGGGGKRNAIVITVEAVTLAEAYSLLNSMVSYTPTLSHTKIVVFGQELAREGVQDIMGPIMRFRQYRGSMHVAVAQGTAEDFFKGNQPAFDITMSKYYETMMEAFVESSYYLDTSLHVFYMRLKSLSGQPYATMIAINQQSGDGAEGGKVPGGKADTYIAGKIPRQGGNKAEFIGTAVFRGDKMVGMLDSDETRMLSILTGAFSRGFLSVEDPLEPKRSVNAFLGLEKDPTIDTYIENDVPYIKVAINLEGEITAVPSGIRYEKEEYLSLLEQQVSNVIAERMERMIKHTQALGTDVAGFGYFYRSHFLTRPGFNEFNWLDKYSKASITVQVKTNLRRYGLMSRTNAIHGK